MKKAYRKSQKCRKGRRKERRARKKDAERQAIEQAEQVQLPLGIEALAEMARQSLSTFAHRADCGWPSA